jgi:hypothetical protein
MNEEVYYQNADILLMDPCYLREDGDDEDFELYCSDLVVDTFSDGYYYVIRGDYYENIKRMKNISQNLNLYNLGEFTLDSARIGVYDYLKVIKEHPTLKDIIEKKKIIAVVIRSFTGRITCVTDEAGEVSLVGKSENRQQDFFTYSF